MKDHPLSVDASPTALSPGYIANSDPKEDKEDLEEDPADHPARIEGSEDAEVVTTDESAPRPPTPYHLIFELNPLWYRCLSKPYHDHHLLRKAFQVLLLPTLHHHTTRE
ncbi:hypothetical protein Tco_0822476 [Tanacetum coccineum]|uniref:Uncharacterized protein n=1 Tax=Tanacetum coccineum TaxID=301880 RepID=A0ABQ5AHT2_9ASTR